MRVFLGALALVVALVAGYAWWRMRPTEPDEVQINRVILQVRQAVEMKDAGAVLRNVSDNYDDGAHRKRDITRMVVSGFRQPEPFRLHVEPPRVSVSGDRAQAVIHARFAAGHRSELSQGLDLKVKVDFAKEGGRWKVISASGWEPAAHEYD